MQAGLRPACDTLAETEFCRKGEMAVKKNAGFTLIEVLVAIVLLGALVIPVSSGMIMTLRMNEKTEQLMQAQLAVSSAVEELMATGITEASDNYRADDFPNVTVKTTRGSEELPYYNVTVTCNDITVTTQIREVAPTTPMEEEGDTP